MQGEIGLAIISLIIGIIIGMISSIKYFKWKIKQTVKKAKDPLGRVFDVARIMIPMLQKNISNTRTSEGSDYPKKEEASKE